MLNEFKHWIGDSATDRLVKEGRIEHSHIQMLLGYTFRKKYILVDEA